jgi:hypothetical protein
MKEDKKCRNCGRKTHSENEFCSNSHCEYHPPQQEELKFMECDNCIVKPGSPILCDGCLNNRRVIEELSTHPKDKETWEEEKADEVVNHFMSKGAVVSKKDFIYVKLLLHSEKSALVKEILDKLPKEEKDMEIFNEYFREKYAGCEDNELDYLINGWKKALS